MNDLTDYQRSILIAMLQGRDIQLRYNLLGWQKAVPWEIFKALSECPDAVQIAPNQPEAMRLYGEISPNIYAGGMLGRFMTNKDELVDYYIDISPNGFIVGGKIEESK